MKPTALYILPFDHRASFTRDLLGVDGKPNAAQRKKVSELKEIIYRGYLKSRGAGKDGAILVDEEYGKAIIRDMKKRGITLVLTTEKSGKQSFEFEYGADFKKHLAVHRPKYAKALVRYNPANKKDNAVSLRNLKKLSDACRKLGIGLLIEPLVPATQTQLRSVRGSQSRYDRELRGRLTARALTEMIRAGIRVDIWKLEAMESAADWKRVIAVTKQTPVVVLGRNASMRTVRGWFKTAAPFSQTIGFAVGRTIFHAPLGAYIAGELTKAEASTVIARDFTALVKLWKYLKQKTN